MIRPRFRRPRDRRGRSRRGMTIVEIMVAILVLGVGLLALAGFSIAAGAQLRGAHLQETAALVVQSRLDSLASITCVNLAPGGPQSGTATTLGVKEKWVITDGNDIKTIVDTVTFKYRTRKLVYQSVIPCRD